MDALRAAWTPSAQLDFAGMSCLESLARSILPSLLEPSFSSLPVTGRGQAAIELLRNAPVAAPAIASTVALQRPRSYPIICFRGDVHEALTGVTLAIVEQHLLDSFRLLIRNAFSPWSLYHYLLRTHFRWWNV